MPLWHNKDKSGISVFARGLRFVLILLPSIFPQKVGIARSAIKEQSTSIHFCRSVFVPPVELSFGIADTALSSVVCVALLRPRGHAALRRAAAIPLRWNVTFSPLVMRSMKSRRQACSTGSGGRSVRGLGGSPTSVSEYPTGYPRNIAGLR